MGSCRNDVLETRTSGTSAVRLTDAHTTTETQDNSVPVVGALATRHWGHQRAFVRCQVDLPVFLRRKQFLVNIFAMRHLDADSPCLLKDATNR